MSDKITIDLETQLAPGVYTYKLDAIDTSQIGYLGLEYRTVGEHANAATARGIELHTYLAATIHDIDEATQLKTASHDKLDELAAVAGMTRQAAKAFCFGAGKYSRGEWAMKLCDGYACMEPPHEPVDRATFARRIKQYLDGQGWHPFADPLAGKSKGQPVIPTQAEIEAYRIYVAAGVLAPEEVRRAALFDRMAIRPTANRHDRKRWRLAFLKIIPIALDAVEEQNRRKTIEVLLEFVDLQVAIQLTEPMPVW